MKVFIVDDSRAFQKELINLLSKLKEVEIIGQAQDSVKAMEAIPKLKPDVVILDIPMPGGKGIDVLENIKKGKSPPIVIMFTNYPYRQYRKKYMDAGADYFLDKSTEFNEVIKILNNIRGKN